MGEVSESEGVAAEGFEAAVDGFGGAVGGVVVEVGQYVGAAPMEGAAELGEFFECGGDTVAKRVDDLGHRGLAAAPVGVCVGGDQALIEPPRQFDGQVVLVSENRFQPVFLAGTKQRVAGTQGAPNPVERIAGATAIPAGLLLDALAAQVELVAG